MCSNISLYVLKQPILAVDDMNLLFSLNNSIVYL